MARVWREDWGGGPRCLFVLAALALGAAAKPGSPTFLIEPWGSSSLRIRIALSGGVIDKTLPGALVDEDAASLLSPSPRSSTNIKATVGSDGSSFVVTRVSDGVELLRSTAMTMGTCDTAAEGCDRKATLDLAWAPEHQLFGAGQHMNTHGIPGRLPPHHLDDNASLPSMDMRNGTWDFQSCTVYSDSSGAEICIPWVVAASPEQQQYEFGMLWNNPNFGSMSLSHEGVDGRSRWVANDPTNDQIDLWVTTFDSGASGSSTAAAMILEHYVKATGRSPMMPDWAAGYWHSPMGYPDFNQSIVMDAVDGLMSRNIPTDLYVIDYYNWRTMGDYAFNPSLFPDPKGMVAHLEKNGIRLMVSAWPFVEASGARASASIAAPGTRRGVQFSNGSLVPWPDSVCGGECYLYDPTSSEGRDWLFSFFQSGYISDGVTNFWFDASEPESLADFQRTDPASGKKVHYGNPLGQPQGSTFAGGTNQQIGMMFPVFHAQMVTEGLKRLYPDQTPVTLARSGWAGQQRYGVANWNGDLQASWENFKKTIVAGLNAQLSGMAWWTHDIGAIGGCDISSAEYRELLVRWFQFGLTSPVFRQHGSRPVEPWELQKYGPSGEAAYAAVVKMIRLRRALRPYVLLQMRAVADTGLPVNRPLSFDFPGDPKTWAVPDQYMFGPKFMAAPIYRLGKRSRVVYFPRGGATGDSPAGCCKGWRQYGPAGTGNVTEPGLVGPAYAPGTTAEVAVPYDALALFACEV